MHCDGASFKKGIRQVNARIASSIALLSASAPASASFTGFAVSSSSARVDGVSLTVYTVAARFNGPTDTLLYCFNFGATLFSNSSLTGFWHKDAAYSNSGVLSQSFGTWSPSQVGPIPSNRPFDSYLTIGGLAGTSNSSSADPTWLTGGNADARGWHRPDLPDNGLLSWFNAAPPNLQGRVGQPGNTATDVRIGQFVLSQDDPTQWNGQRRYTASVGYNTGVPGSTVLFATSFFTLPSPSGLALAGCLVLVGSRRR